MNNYQLFIDTWQDGGNIDFSVLAQNGVAAVASRINDIDYSTGNFIPDTGFQNNYNGTIKAGLIPLIYFIYNPWRTGQQNFDYLQSIMPSTAKSVFADIEVARLGYSSDAYAADVQIFTDLCNLHWNTAIYTGAGFLQLLSKWPTDVPYWWAEYPSAFYPNSTQNWTWDNVRNALSGFQLPLNNSQVPAKLFSWQFTGDKIIPTGCQSPMDIDVFYGTLADLQNWAGGQYIPVTPPIPQPVSTIPVLVKQEIWFDKVGYREYNITMVRPNLPNDSVNYHVVKINVSDLQDIIFDWSVAETSNFLANNKGIQIAINGLDGFTTSSKGITLPTGFVAYQGSGIGKLGNEEILWVSKDFKFTLDTVPNPMWSGCGFPNLLVRDGQAQSVSKSLTDIRARTLFGLSQDQTIITLIFVEGAEYNAIPLHGFNFPESTSLLLSEGCWTGIMADSGGSSTLVKVGDNGLPEIIGKPNGENLPDHERSVLVHTGFILKPSNTPSPSPTPKPTASKTLNIYNNGNYLI